MASETDLKTLETVLGNTRTLVLQLEGLLYATATNKPLPTAPSSSASPDDSVDPLALAHDAASLIRAHTTKLSLLIINDPFTPSAIVKVLRELNAGPIPGLASAAQACEPSRCTTAAREEIAWRCYRVLHEFKSLLEIIPLDGKSLAGHANNKAGKGGNGSLAATGVIWNACDDVIALKKLSIAGLLVKKVEEYRDTLKDVLEELKEWSEEMEEEEDDGDDDDDADGAVASAANQMQNTHISNQQMIDDLMDTQTIPRGDPDKIRERLESCLKRLRLTTLLYSAVVKRRLKTVPPLPEPSGTESPIAQRLDEVVPILKRLPVKFNDLTCAFYDLDPSTIDRLMDACFFDAFAVSEMLSKPWTGDKDEFTEWADKFQAGIKKPD